MHIKQTLLRAAAAATAIAVMTLGAGASAQAATVSGDASGKGTTQSAEAKDNGEAGKQNAEANQAAAADNQEDAQAADGADHSEGNASTHGEYDEPQPESTADENDGGANAGTCGTDPAGPYCSTRDGSASENGKGDGEATGRPAAGTVGKADNTNPRGQLPGPESDGNNGYECDGNQGIAQGNPAHTGCAEAGASDSQDAGTPSSSPPGVEGVTLPAEETAETAETAEVLGVEAERSAPATVLGEQATANRAPAVIAPVAGVLPATGAGDYAMLLVGGGALIAAGAVVLARRRGASA